MLDPATWPPHDPEIFAALAAAWNDGSWGRYDGPNLQRLIAALAEFQQVEHVLPCSSGTVAVELALRGLGIGPDDEVLVAGYDFPGNFRCIEAVGAKPVLADIDAQTWCLTVASLEAAVGPQSRAVIVSHLHGGLAPMRAIGEFCAARGLAIVEDACQAPGAVIEGRPAGTWGDVGVLSFGGSKLLTAGRGGAMVTRRADIFQRAKIFADRGNNAFPLSELQAAVLVPQIARLAERNAQRWLNVCRLLAGTKSVAALRAVSVASPTANAQVAPDQPSFYKLAWLWDDAAASGVSRDAFLCAAKQAGIPIDAGFRGFAGRSGKRCRRPAPLTNSERAADTTVILHHPILLHSPAQIDELAAELCRVVRQLTA